MVFGLNGRKVYSENDDNTVRKCRNDRSLSRQSYRCSLCLKFDIGNIAVSSLLTSAIIVGLFSGFIAKLERIADGAE